MKDTWECPWCDADIEIEVSFDTLCTDIPCPVCGKPISPTYDYDSGGGGFFGIERAYIPDDEPKE